MSDKEEFSIEEDWRKLRIKYNELLKSLPDKFPVKSPQLSENLLLRVQHIKASLNYRTADLTGASIKLLEENKFLASTIITRSVYETMALLFYLFERIERVVKEKKLGDVEDTLLRIAGGSKGNCAFIKPDGEKLTPINILTAIDKLDKKYDNTMREFYDSLCESAHPNFFGTLGQFARLNENQDYVVFSFDAVTYTQDEPEIESLVVLNLCLDAVFYYNDEIENILPDFEIICKEEG